MFVLEIDNLSFSYNNQQVLKDINLRVEDRDFLAIIGPNGGGKSTLLKLILGINSSKYGTIKIFGDESLKNISQIGYVSQNTNININFPIKVIEVVLMGENSYKKTLFGYKKDEIKVAKKALQQVGMENFYNTKIGSLSGGQRQRVMIARAICSNPKILLLDEPTSNIDTEGQKKIYDLLKELNKNITIVVVSHDISIILEYSNKVAYINKKLSYHDISNNKKRFYKKGEHFCEVELLQMLGKC